MESFAMAHADFVHLRVHTAYSLSEGAITIDTLTELCKTRKMPAVAITDTNNLFGALEFASAAAKAGVQPVIGCQLSISREIKRDAPGAMNRALNGSRNGGSGPEIESDPMVLLVQHETGYRNLFRSGPEAPSGRIRFPAPIRRSGCRSGPRFWPLRRPF